MSAPFLAKTAISCAVPAIIEHAPNAVKAVWCYFFGNEETVKPIGDLPQIRPPQDIPVTPKKPRKVRDNTPWTQAHFDYIIEVHAAWQDWNNTHPGRRRTQDELAVFLNSQMRLDKSASAYSTIFNGYVDRDSLPAGKVDFDTSIF